MGIIKKITQKNNKKVHVTLEISPEELKRLEGNIDNVHIIAEEFLKHESRLIKRGKRESTKYFLLPKSLREDILPNDLVMCNRIEMGTYFLYLFSVPTLKIDNKEKKGSNGDDEEKEEEK